LSKPWQALPQNWEHIVNFSVRNNLIQFRKREELMGDPSPAAANKSLAATPTAGDINASPEHGIARSAIPRQHKSRQTTEHDADRIRSAVMRLVSNSIEELEGLTAELHKLQEFLKCETERVQHEIDSVLSGVSIIVDTIAPWKEPAAPAVRSSPTNQGLSAREKLKHWPPPPAD
jgi:hypothetical protein